MCQNNTNLPLSFMEDNQTVNILRNSRELTGSRQKVPYSLPWRDTTLAVMTFCQTAPTVVILCSTMSSVLNMNYDVNYVGSRLNKICSDNERPDPMWREYSKGFPAIARKVGLFRRPLTTAERQLELAARDDSRGLPRFVYGLKNPEIARDYLITTFPKMMGVFQALYVCRKQNKI